MCNLLFKIPVTEAHIKEGNIRSVMNDPIGLAIREFFKLKIPPDVVAVGDDEIFVAQKEPKRLMTAEFDVKGYYSSDLTPRVISLSFKVV